MGFAHEEEYKTGMAENLKITVVWYSMDHSGETGYYLKSRHRLVVRGVYSKVMKDGVKAYRKVQIGETWTVSGKPNHLIGPIEVPLSLAGMKLRYVVGSMEDMNTGRMFYSQLEHLSSLPLERRLEIYLYPVEATARKLSQTPFILPPGAELLGKKEMKRKRGEWGF